MSRPAAPCPSRPAHTFLGILTVCVTLATPLFDRPATAQEAPVVTAVWGLAMGGTALTGFSSARGLLVDGASIYLSDPQNHRLLVLANGGGIRREISRPGDYPGELLEPAGIAFSAPGEIAVADLMGDRVHFFSTEGVFLGRWGIPGTDAGQLHRPTAIAVDAAGLLYIADGADRIQVFTRNGEYRGTLTTPGTGSGQTYDIANMVFGPDGALYVADGGSRIQKFSTEGALLGTIGGPGSGPGQFAAPLGLGFDAGGDLIVADSGNFRAQRFSAGGMFVQAWGSAGRELGQFYRPISVALSSSGQILIGEDTNSRVQQFCFGPGCVGRPGTPPTLLDCPKVLLHVTPVSTGNGCDAAVLSDCRAAVSEGRCSPEGERYFVYLIVGRTKNYSEGIAGLECGISYENGKPEDVTNGTGLDILGWQLCATLEFPTPGAHPWPAPGSGNLITWDPAACGPYRPMVAGYFYVAAYSPDRLFITPRPVSGLAKAATCEARELPLQISELGYASFTTDGQVPGCNPCIVDDCSPGQTFRGPSLPVERTSWSGIKALFQR